MVVARERIWLTEDRKAVVGEGHRKAAFLYATPGDEIPDEAAERLGIIDGLAGPQSTQTIKLAPEPDTPELRERLKTEIFPNLNTAHDFTAKGYPKSDSVSVLLGKPVQAKVIAAAWDELTDEEKATMTEAGAKADRRGEDKSGKKGKDKGSGEGTDKAGGGLTVTSKKTEG